MLSRMVVLQKEFAKFSSAMLVTADVPEPLHTPSRRCADLCTWVYLLQVSMGRGRESALIQLLMHCSAPLLAAIGKLHGQLIAAWESHCIR